MKFKEYDMYILRYSPLKPQKENSLFGLFEDQKALQFSGVPSYVYRIALIQLFLNRF